MRFGQQAEGIVIIGNSVRGYRWAVLLKTTIYETIITPADPNYYYTGVRNVTIDDNDFYGGYYTSAAGLKGNHLKNTAFGVLCQISGTWEDKAQGAWDIADISVGENRCDDVGYSYVFERVSMSGGVTPPDYVDFAVNLKRNRSTNAQNDVIRTSVSKVLGVTYEGNTWADEQDWTPDIVGTTTPGTQTYTTRVGKWVARGRRVRVEGRMVLATKDAAMAGNPVISGIPGTVRNVLNSNKTGVVGLWGGWTLSTNYTDLVVYAEPNTSRLRVGRCGSGQTAAFVGVSEMGGTAQLDFACEYEV
jgi:hypothetical protein